MGFEYHPDTAGSSVRFDPPDPRDEVRDTIFQCLLAFTICEISQLHSISVSLFEPSPSLIWTD